MKHTKHSIVRTIERTSMSANELADILQDGRFVNRKVNREENYGLIYDRRNDDYVVAVYSEHEIVTVLPTKTYRKRNVEYRVISGDFPTRNKIRVVSTRILFDSDQLNCAKLFESFEG